MNSPYARVVSVKGNSIRVSYGLISFDAKIDDATGYITFPKDMFIQPAIYGSIVALIKLAYAMHKEAQ